MKTHEYIKAIKPKLKSMASKELPSSPAITKLEVNGWNGSTYESITFVATCKYSLFGQDRKE